MDGNFETKVMCCFCGESMNIENSLILEVFPSMESEESQGLYCHKKCFIDKIHKSVILHPNIIKDI